MGKYNKIVKIDQIGLHIHITKTVLHEALKSRWCIWQAEAHSVALVKPEWPDGECCLIFVRFLHLYLPVCALNVKAAEPASAVKWVKHIVDARQSICIYLGLRIQISEVDTESNLTIWLANQDHWACLWTLRYPDGIQGKHLLQMFTAFIIHGKGNAMIWELKCTLIKH